jgi:hypothetical protein
MEGKGGVIMATPKEAELERVTRLRGFRYGIHDFFAELDVNALKAGASPEEIMEALELIGSWTGTVNRTKGLEAWRAVFRPDLPTIDRVVELR